MSWQGSGTPSLEQQIVGKIATKQFYIGIFGLDPKPTNFSNFNDPIPSFMTTLKERNHYSFHLLGLHSWQPVPPRHSPW